MRIGQGGRGPESTGCWAFLSGGIVSFAYGAAGRRVQAYGAAPGRASRGTADAWARGNFPCGTTCEVRQGRLPFLRVWTWKTG